MDCTVFDALLDGVVIIDPIGKILYCNDSVNLILSPTTPRFRKGVLLQKIFNSGEIPLPFLNGDTPVQEDLRQYKEIAIRTNDGDVIHLMVNLQWETEETGKVVHWIYFFRDVTVEEALDLKYKKALERKEQAFRELQEIQDQLIQTSKTAVIGQFVASVTHELNNPLSYVLSAVQELSIEVKSNEIDVESVRKLVELAETGATRIMEMSNRLKSFLHSPMESKRFTLGNLTEIIERAVGFTNHYTRAQNIKILNNIPVEVPLTLLDSSAIEQIAINLIRNASDAMSTMEPGKERKLEITGRFHEKSQAIIIAFKDTGPGIPLETRRKLFQPFFTTKDVGKGTGLGLNICASIAERHGGTLSVDSSNGPGATFYLTLPVRKKLEAASDASLIDFKGVKVLVVDDEPWIRMLEKSALTKLGCNVVEAGSGTEALKMCEQDTPQVILTDYSMDGMTGQQFAEKVKRLYPKVRIILVTGSIVMKDIDLEGKVFDDFVSKPFPKDSIIDAVKRVLSI